MRSNRLRLPALVLALVAVLALSVATYGTAVGGPSVAKLTNAKVKKIAKKQIAVAAPALAGKTIPAPKPKVNANGGVPMPRWGTPEDLQGAAVFLASKASDYCHAASIEVDGAWLSR